MFMNFNQVRKLYIEFLSVLFILPVLFRFVRFILKVTERKATNQRWQEVL